MSKKTGPVTLDLFGSAPSKPDQSSPEEPTSTPSVPARQRTSKRRGEQKADAQDNACQEPPRMPTPSDPDSIPSPPERPLGLVGLVKELGLRRTMCPGCGEMAIRLTNDLRCWRCAI